MQNPVPQGTAVDAGLYAFYLCVFDIAGTMGADGCQSDIAAVYLQRGEYADIRLQFAAQFGLHRLPKLIPLQPTHQPKIPGQNNHENAGKTTERPNQNLLRAFSCNSLAAIQRNCCFSSSPCHGGQIMPYTCARFKQIVRTHVNMPGLNGKNACS